MPTPPSDIVEALNPPHAPPAPTAPAGGWPIPLADVVSGWSAIGQDRIANQITAMTPEQRQRLIDEFPKQVGNTDGVPWAMRIAANRVNIAQAIADERREGNPGSQGRIAFYQGLLGEVDDPARSGRRVDRQILAFDPDRASLIELNGSLATAKSVAVMVPGLNTTIEDSAANTKTARRFVSATRGEVAAITYLGGPFPRGDNPSTGLVDAADPRYALDMAPRLVAFSEDVDRTVDATGRDIPVTYIGHSYGGSIMGTAEVFGPDRRPDALSGRGGSRRRRRRSIRLAQPQPRRAAILDDRARRLHRSGARQSGQPARRRPRRHAWRNPFGGR